uniref:Uncharacterized protein n=1 Tax=Entomoneis paludosa TaxID=265537 RepID=A0A6U3BVB3_9STRA|mmetsp:Transcript_32516/g.67817  ORF Transcript_32516/g.67817 Transcript_32516/m.67817 type:complete len:318 (+) Transcript_32516:109-1062(+)|eukprot:CAMPEP_0172453700 /NCGR_PEP_ID=MMETSP1065-20121228/10901_1 /TAXON_ID=265537 /ORGANISM="Amphiprora paludosa, Strain CCMP125" /LENGTH=317 /DNA_ID=CAMNT_0013205897 /DNA_START=92 /DNA_END=1045 /DNA_ORIENTATION=+
MNLSMEMEMETPAVAGAATMAQHYEQDQSAPQSPIYDPSYSYFDDDDVEDDPQTLAYYEYKPVEGSAMANDKPVGMSLVPGPPLPADRLARKQRNFPRRGGFVHSSLLRSAVYACMSDGEGPSPETPNSLSVTDLLNGKGGKHSSPRKRMRRTDHKTRLSRSNSTATQEESPTPNGNSPTGAPSASEDAVIARATDLLQRLCVNSLDPSDHKSGKPAQRPHRPRLVALKNHTGASMLTSHSSSHNRRLLARRTLSVSSRHSTSRMDEGDDHNDEPDQDDDADFERAAPVRRVSRRTSYQSQISTGTADYEDDLDEFH